MLYKFVKSTLRYREGQKVDFDPDHIHTRQRLERGIIVPVKTRKRETKPAFPDEVKDDSADE